MFVQMRMTDLPFVVDPVREPLSLIAAQTADHSRISSHTDITKSPARYWHLDYRPFAFQGSGSLSSASKGTYACLGEPMEAGIGLTTGGDDTGARMAC